MDKYTQETKEKVRKYINLLCSNYGTKMVYEYIQKELSTEFSESLIKIILKNIDINISKKIISKDEAKNICKLDGIKLIGGITFASLNKGVSTYWANPNKKVLLGNWWLLLNDTENYKLHIINIPANAIKQNQLVFRSDTPEKIDIQIDFGDGLFEDKRSGFQFKKYYIKTIKYDDLSD
jgi:hypothetical protein